MPVNQQTFDADLAAYVTGDATLIAAQSDYIAAVTAFLALPQVVDLAAEDAQVQSALQNAQTALAAVQAAKAALPPPPGPAKA